MQISPAKKEKLKANLGKSNFADLHPRYPAGHPKGGKFMPKGSADYVKAVAKNTGKSPQEVKKALGGDGDTKPSSTAKPAPQGKRNYKDILPPEAVKEIQDNALALAAAAKAQDIAEQAKLNASKGGKREAGKAFTAAKKEVSTKQKAVEAVLVKHGASKEKAKEIAEKLIAQKVGQVKDGAKPIEKSPAKAVAEKTKAKLDPSKLQSLKEKIAPKKVEPKLEAKKVEPKILVAPPKSKESIGRGAFGEVYLTPEGTAYKSSLGGKFLAKEEIDIMVKAGQLGVAPIVKGVHSDANGNIKGVEMDYLSSHKPLWAFADNELEPKAKAKAIESLSNSFAELHKNGILHGDTHGRNVMFSKEGDAKIVDYGLSSRIDRDNPKPDQLERWREDVLAVRHMLNEELKGKELKGNTGKISSIYKEIGDKLLVQGSTNQYKDIYQNFISKLNK